MAVLGLPCSTQAFSSAVSKGYSPAIGSGFSLRWLLLLQSTGSAVVAHGPSCSVAGAILPEQGWSLCPPQWQVDSQPLDPQRSPFSVLLWREVGDLNQAHVCIHSFEALRDAVTWNPRISRKAGAVSLRGEQQNSIVV